MEGHVQFLQQKFVQYYFTSIQRLCLPPLKNRYMIQTISLIDSIFLSFSITQVSTQYKSSLPDFLLNFIDAIIRVDKSQILRYNFLHYNIDDLLRQNVEECKTVCIFVDPEGEEYMFQEDISKKIEQFPFRPTQSFINETWNDISPEQFAELNFQPNPFLCKVLKKSQILKLCDNNLVTIDQIRAKCQTNVYFDPEDVLYDIKTVLAWNQLFRASSSASFTYISLLFTNILEIINKKNFHSKFYNQKKIDFEKLSSYDSPFRIQSNKWPFIPDNFRHYEEIDHYEPSLPERSQIVNKKLQTKKQPIKCPQNCSCLGCQEDFCKYSLKDIWHSQCPNRQHRVECQHDDPLQRQRCLNSQIKKGQRKKCKKDDETEEGNDIEECIIWGIDMYTRNIINNCLPECDVDFIEVLNNRECKNTFIEKTLLKAVNFNGNEGYSIKKACQFIIKNRKMQENNFSFCMEEEKPIHNWSSKIVKKQVKYGEGLFSNKEAFYAEILLKNYEFGDEESNQTFRIHTKGKGARCINKNGIKEGRFIVEYYGEIYQPWKWYERQDFIKQTLKSKAKEVIPQFYNIYLQTHKDDPEGYDLMVVDPINKGNFSSRFSHSCNPNCGTVATISNGKYYIGMYSFRDIQYGQQLTFDYCSMTQSNYEHTHSICLCGMERCRGFYLSLANSRKYNQILDKSTCFLSRNSLILRALQDVTEEDVKRCSDYNIKERMLEDSPQWIIKWTSNLLKFMESEAEMYKKELIQLWTKQYPWQEAQENKGDKIQLYSQTHKQDLLSLRFQNLFTTIDKLKYFLNSINDSEPPLFYLEKSMIVNYMINDKESILQEIQDVFIKFQKKAQIQLVEKFFTVIRNPELDDDRKLFFFRLCCLCVSHFALQTKPNNKFNTILFSDIVYFYAFTHTYFSAKQYKSHSSKEISVNLGQITGDSKHLNVVKKVNKKYSSQFVWGQLVSWYKQTIVSPQSSLSQDRRGTLSFPMIKSTLNSSFPYEKNCRRNFHKAIKEKPASCWPPAPNSGCYLSFKNPFKCYGTMLFQSVHNAQKLKELGGENLIERCLQVINSPFKKKLELFKKVETLLEGIKENDEGYEILQYVEQNCYKFDDQLPDFIQNEEIEYLSKPRKKNPNKKFDDL